IKQNNNKKKNIHSSNYDSFMSNSSLSYGDYESFDSSCDVFNFLSKKNKKDNEEQNNLFLNKDIHKKKLRIERKNAIKNNLIKIIKYEEENQNELKKKKNYLLKVLDKKNKKLINNKKHLNEIVQLKKKESQRVLNRYNSLHETKCSNTGIITSLNNWTNKKDEEPNLNIITNNNITHKLDPNEGCIYDYQYTPVYKEQIDLCLLSNSDNNSKSSSGSRQSSASSHEQKKDEAKFSEPNDEITTSMTKMEINPIYDAITKNEDVIKNMYKDIDEIFKIELSKLNQKIKLIIKINFLNISLYTNIHTLTKILKNVYLKKYNIVLQSGKKVLNIANYDYTKFKKSYDTGDLIKNVQKNNLCNENTVDLESVDKSLVSLYKRINENQIKQKET
ncbi:hypothetical protein HEP_00474800, partial [Hepatocystis sp. ex Piliocolobus tephrosceles]